MTQTARPSGSAPADPAGPEDLDVLVEEWLPLPDVAERLGIEVGKVRRLVQDQVLLAVRRGEPRVLSVPARFLVPADPESPFGGPDGGGSMPLPDLKGTLTVLADSGYDNDEAVRWLFTPDESLPGTPVDALRAGRKTEVRRRAQALAF